MCCVLCVLVAGVVVCVEKEKCAVRGARCVVSEPTTISNILVVLLVAPVAVLVLSVRVSGLARVCSSLACKYQVSLCSWVEGKRNK